MKALASRPYRVDVPNNGDAPLDRPIREDRLRKKEMDKDGEDDAPHKAHFLPAVQRNPQPYCSSISLWLL